MQIKIRDTCTLPGTMVQSVLAAYDKWGHMPPYPLICVQVITSNHIKRFKKEFRSKQTLKLCLVKCNLAKDKNKEALFNVAYNVTDNISSCAILRHNNYISNRYLPVFIFLAQPLFYASVSKGAASTIFHTFGMVRLRDSNPRPPAPKANALPTKLSGR